MSVVPPAGADNRDCEAVVSCQKHEKACIARQSEIALLRIRKNLIGVSGEYERWQGPSRLTPFPQISVPADTAATGSPCLVFLWERRKPRQAAAIA